MKSTCLRVSNNLSPCCYLRVFCGLFNEMKLSAAQTTQCRMVRRLMSHELGRMFKKGMRTISRYYPSLPTGRIGKIKKTFNQSTRCPGQDSRIHATRLQLGKTCTMTLVLAVFNQRVTKFSSFILPVEWDWVPWYLGCQVGPLWQPQMMTGKKKRSIRRETVPLLLYPS
jgi:hypothetical protein